MPMFFRKPKPAHATQLKAQFMSSKLEWDREFSRSIQEQCQEYLNEETQQSEGEKFRNSKFDGMMYELDEQFSAKAAQRDKAFQDAQGKQEDIFRVNEAEREKQFLAGEGDRGVMFHHDQERHRKLSIWYINVRLSQASQGRLEREKICQKLEDDLREQFERLLRFQEECFASAEHQRDEIVSGILMPRGEFLDSNARKQDSGSSDTAPSRYFATTAAISQANPVAINTGGYPRDQFVCNYLNTPALSRSTSRTLSRREASPPRSVSRSSSPYYRGGKGIGSKSSSITQEVGTTLPNTGKVEGPVFEGWFQATLTRYQEEYRSEEEHRDARFNEAERARGYAEEERSRLFQLHESTRDSEFAQMMTFQWQQYDTKESSRNAEEGWRMERFEGWMERRSWLFEQEIRQAERQHSVASVVEDEFILVLKSRIEKLVRTQQKKFEEVRERLSITFTRSQTQRETKLGTTGDAPSTSGVTPLVGISPDQPPSLYSGVPPTPITVYASPDTDMLPRDRMGSRSFHGDQWYTIPVPPPATSPYKWRSWYTYSPLRPTSFDFHHLPQSTNGTIKEFSSQAPDVSKSKFSNDEHRTRQLDFDRSQAERRRHFEDGIRRRQCIFLANERIRDENFESNQRNFTNTSFGAEKERDLSFMHSQQERERRFVLSEARRASIFCDAEAERVAANLEAQKRRGERFDALQDKLQKQCLEDEVRRTSDLEMWASALLQEREQQLVEGYKGDERTREERFVRYIQK